MRKHISKKVILRREHENQRILAYYLALNKYYKKRINKFRKRFKQK